MLVNRNSYTENPAGGVNPAQQPNVGQYGWTAVDLSNVNQLIQYVNASQLAAENSQASADYVQSIAESFDSKLNNVHISKMLSSDSTYLDLPGRYFYNTKFSGTINPESSVSVYLNVPNKEGPSHRAVSLWVLIKEVTSNTISSYRVDGLWFSDGTSGSLIFGNKYSTIGLFSEDITISNNSTTNTSVGFMVNNTHNSNQLQVILIPEVSNIFGEEE